MKLCTRIWRENVGFFLSMHNPQNSFECWNIWSKYFSDWYITHNDKGIYMIEQTKKIVVFSFHHNAEIINKILFCEHEIYSLPSNVFLYWYVSTHSNIEVKQRFSRLWPCLMLHYMACAIWYMMHKSTTGLQNILSTVCQTIWLISWIKWKTWRYSNNLLCVKFCWKNINTYLDLISFFHTEIAQVFETFLMQVNQFYQKYHFTIISWPLMIWRCRKSGHQ